MKIKLVFFTVLSFFCFQVCSSEKKSSNSVSKPPQNGLLLSTGVEGNLTPAQGAPAESVQNVNIYVQDKPELTTKTDNKGNFKIEGAQPGTLAIMAIGDGTPATSLAPGGGSAISGYGVQFEEFILKPNEKKQLAAKALQKLGGIKGKVSLYQNPNNLSLLGIDVFIGGTPLLSKTDAEGNFSLPPMPPGKYNVSILASGFAVTNYKNVEVREAEYTEINDATVSLSTGPEGTISISNAQTIQIQSNSERVLNTNSAEIALSFDSNAALMKLSDEPSFLNKSWEPVAKNKTWNFNSDGKKTLYVKYSDLNGLESSPYSAPLIVDVENPKISQVKILNGWAQTASSQVYTDIWTLDAGTGVKEYQVRMGDDNFSAGDIWQTYQPRVNINLPAGTGNVDVYFRVRDYMGNISTVAYDFITQGSETLISDSVYTSDLVLDVTRSPYKTNTLEIGTNVTINAGVTLVVDGNVKIKGYLKSLGTSTNSVLITSVISPLIGHNCRNSKILDLSFAAPKVSVATELKHTTLGYLTFVMNGGKLEDSIVDNNLCDEMALGDYGIVKKGLDPLLVKNLVLKQVHKAFTIMDGIATTKIENVTGTAGIILSQQNLASKTQLDGNSISRLTGGICNDESGIQIKSGSFFLNNFVSNGNSERCPLFEVDSGGQFTASNITATGTASGSGFRFFLAKGRPEALGTTYSFSQLQVTNAAVAFEYAPVETNKNYFANLSVSQSEISFTDALYFGGGQRNGSSSAIVRNPISISFANNTANGLICAGRNVGDTSTNGCSFIEQRNVSDFVTDTVTFDGNHLSCPLVRGSSGCSFVQYLHPGYPLANATPLTHSLNFNIQNNKFLSRAIASDFSNANASAIKRPSNFHPLPNYGDSTYLNVNLYSGAVSSTPSWTISPATGNEVCTGSFSGSCVAAP